MSPLPPATLTELFLSSYLATPRQQRIGERRQVGPVSCVHYDYFWGGNRITADNIFVGPGQDIPAVMEAISNYRPAAENQIFVPLESAAVSQTMARLGCEQTGLNYLMDRPLTTADRQLIPAVPVYKIRTPEEVRLYNNIHGGSMALRTDTMNPAFRFYYIMADGRPVAHGRSWQCRPSVSWESHIYTDPNFQRRGFGKAMMVQILRDNAAAGMTYSVLESTEAGHRLYRQVGYRDRMTIGCFKLHLKR